MLRAATFGIIVAGGIALPATKPTCAEDGWRKTTAGWEHSGRWIAGPLTAPTEPVAVPLGRGAVHPLTLVFGQLFVIAAALAFLTRAAASNSSAQTSPADPC